MATGWHHSEDAKKGIAAALRNRIVTEETRKKLSEGRKGIRLSKETRKKISDAKKGTPAWNKGKRDSASKGIPRTDAVKKKISMGNMGKIISVEAREKMSKASIGKRMGDLNPSKTPDARRKISESKTGKPRSEETKTKLSAALIGKPLTAQHIKNMMRRRPKSSLEVKFEEIINKHNLPYIFTGNGTFIIDRCNPDFINTNGEKIAIEVYANFYKEKDGRNIADWKEKRSARFAKYGWSIVYFDAMQVNEKHILSTLGGV